MAVKTETRAAPTTKMLRRLDRLMEEMAALREEVAQLEATHTPSPQVVEWAEKVNEAINDPTLSAKDRQEVIDNVPAPLRHAVAAECYRTNENVTFGWAATIAGVFTWEVPELLRAYGVEPEFATDMEMTVEEMDKEITALTSRGALKR